MKRKRKLKKKPIIFLITTFLLILIIILFIIFKDSFIKKDEKPKTLEKDKNISISMLVAGNIILDQNIIKDGLTNDKDYNFDYLFKNIDIIKNKYDLKYYNQESIIGGSKLGYSLNNKYNSPKEIGDTMTKLGFNLVSTANIHAFDKGEDGIKNSIEYWKTKNVLYSGQQLENKYNPKIKTLKGIKYTMLSYTMDSLTDITKGKEYLLNIYNKDKIKQEIETIRKDVDLLIVSISWNNMKSSDITQEQKDVINHLSSLGVDIVVGNGLYSIQPIEKINNMFVIYSSGNLLSNYSIVDSDTSMITTFNINFNTKEKKIENHTYDDIKTYMLYTTSNNSSNFKVVKYNSLNDNILKNYKDYYNKYSNIIKSKLDVLIEK